MIRVEITNYESIDHAVIEIDGFTTVVGPNYSGKSAAMRAINAALVNQQGTEFIRWGQTFCEVKINAPELDLIWHKEEGNNYYLVNNEKYAKIGRDDPPDDVLKLGYGTVKVSGQKYNLHYADQFTPLFLVDKQDTKSADLVASVYGLDRLYKASDLCSKDQRSNASLLKIRTKDLADAQEDLKKYENLDGVVEELNRLKSEHDRIESEEAAVERAKTWASSITSVAMTCRRLKPAQDVSLPEFDGLDDDIRSYDTASSMMTRMVALSNDVKSLSAIEEVSIPDDSAIQEASDKYLAAASLFSRYEETVRSESKFRGIENISIPEEPSDGIGRLIAELKATREKQESLAGVKNEVLTVKQSLKECEDELKSIETERAEFDRCPLCNQELKAA